VHGEGGLVYNSMLTYECDDIHMIKSKGFLDERNIVYCGEEQYIINKNI